MPNSFLTSYRQDLSSLGIKDDRPDWMVMRDDLIPLAKQNPALLEQYPDFAQEYGSIRDANAPSLIGEAGKAFESGSQSLMSDLDAATALGARAVGLDKVSQHYIDRAKTLQDLAAENAPTIPTVEDIAPARTGLGRVFSKDTARYVAAKAGGALPSLAEIAGLATAGAALGSAAEPGVGTIAGAGEGALEGILDRGIIRSAIKSLVEKGASKGLGEAAVRDAILAGDDGLASAVTTEAKALAAGRTGEGAALGLGAYPLSAGGIYKETGDPELAAGLGAVGALAGAPPVIGLPARVVRSLFPRLSGEAATQAASELVGKKSSELLAKLGRAGIAVGAGTAGTLGMEASNIVAKNITLGKDALALDASDWNRLREAAIGGAIASVPFAGIAARSPEIPSDTTTRAPAAEVPQTATSLPAETAPIAPPAPAARSQADIYRAVTQMAPEEQSARLAELRAIPTPSSEQAAELELLSALAPEPVVAATPSTPPVVPDETVPAPETPTTAAPPENSREAWLRNAINTPGATYQYTVMRFGEPGVPDAMQIDVMGPKGENLASSNPAELRALGVDAPDVPESVKQGQYSIDQIRAEIAKTSAPASEVSSATEITPESTMPEAGPQSVSFKDAGYETQEAFAKDYAEQHVREAFETESEFIMRKFCSGQN
jgi:hypothetical protein